MNNAIRAVSHFIGLTSNKTSHREKIISGLGGFTGIFFILVITRLFVADADAALIVASMGASAVLLFAVPHGTLSQPWALSGGHLVSAAIGVSCYLLVPNMVVAAAASVGLAVTAMYYLRCMHPPGGATALAAVIGSPEVHALGYLYLVTPVLINVAIIFSVALLFNYLFTWRRYPTALMRPVRKKAERNTPDEQRLSREDLEHALRQMNLYVDVSHHDLERIYQLARGRVKSQLSADQIKIGHYYSNGEYADNWSVRQIVDESVSPRPENDQVIYKVIAGKGRRSSGVTSREEFARWAKYEVFLNENSWQRIAASTSRAARSQPEHGEVLNERTSYG